MSTSETILTRLLSLHPKAIDLSLDRLKRLLSKLGNPEDNIPPVIHVAGTNGKGSVCAMLRAGLEGDGKRVHVYTSPHLVDFRERIRLAGALIEEQALSDVLAECERINAGAPITFFEITTAAAFLAFSRVEADYTILEVGLGGRLDATNVIKAPRLCVITTVSMDHQQYLGDTVGKIAFEKAGILKSNVPCIVGVQFEEAQTVIERVAREKGAPLQLAGMDYDIWAERGTRLAFQNLEGIIDLPRPVLPGSHQIENAGMAIAALLELGVSHVGCAAAMTNMSWPGRLQRLDPTSFPELAAGTEVWLDGGHNEAAGRALGLYFADMAEKRSVPLYVICAMMNTKSTLSFLKSFKGLAHYVIGMTIDGEENALSAQDIRRHAENAGLNASTSASLTNALEIVSEHNSSHTPPRILICGSLYFAGQVLREIK